MDKMTNHLVKSFGLCLALALFLSIPTSGQKLSGTIAYPGIIEKVQTNGYKLSCYLHGDERNSFYTTVDGYPILENDKGLFEYARIDINGTIVLSGIIARNEGDRLPSENAFLEALNNEDIKVILYASFKDKPTYSSQSKSTVSFPSSGTQNLLVILIDFTDRTNILTVNDFDLLFNQTNYNNTGSFRDYWLANSYNSLTVNSTVIGWYHASNNESYYGSNESNVPILVREAIDAAENDGLDFSQFDNNNDGEIDDLIIVHSGYGEEAGAPSSSIWSHHWELGSYQRTYDGVTINRYAIVPELRSNIGNGQTHIGVVCHEFGHSLGLPDLYDTKQTPTSEGIGDWGLMGSGNWNMAGISPSNICAWSKDFLDWTTTTLLSGPTNISMINASQDDVIYRINTPNSNEYFLLENRQAIGFDVGLPGTGLAVWHINTSKTSSSHIQANDVNADENLKGVDLEEADGDNDLDNRTNRGDNGDLFPGDDCNQQFDDNSIPNSKTYSPIVNTSKPIEQIIEQNNIIYFHYDDYDPIQGPNLVCSSGATFTLANLPSGETPNWTKSVNLINPSGQGTGSYSVEANPLAPGLGWVQAEFTSDCGDIISRKENFWVGVPYVNPATIQFECADGTGYLCSNAFGNEFSFTYQGPSDYFEVKLTNLSETYTYDQFTIQGTWGTLDCSPPEGTHMFHVRGSNTCGTASNWTKKAVVFQDCGEGGLFEMMVYPNPATDDTKISIVKTDNQKSVEVLDAGWKVEVYTQNNVLKLVDSNIREGIYTLNTSNWPVGIYYIKAYYKNEILNKSLIVSK